MLVQPDFGAESTLFKSTVQYGSKDFYLFCFLFFSPSQLVLHVVAGGGVVETYLENHRKAIARVCSSVSRFEIFMTAMERALGVLQKELCSYALLLQGCSSLIHTPRAGMRPR